MSVYWFIILALLAGYVIFLNKKTDGFKLGKVNWTPLEAINVTLASYFGGQLLGGIVVYVPLLLAGWGSTRISFWFDNSAAGQFLLILAVEAATLLFLYKFVSRRRANFKTLGLKNPQLTDVGYALGGFAVYFLLYIVVVAVARALVPALNVDQQQQIGFEGAHGGQLVLVFVSLVLLPPMVEELLMRGFLYGALKKAWPKVWAVIVTSGLFAVAHLQLGSGAPLLWIAAIDTFILSLVLIYLRDKTGRLWASIGLHMTKNFVAFLVLFVFVTR